MRSKNETFFLKITLSAAALWLAGCAASTPVAQGKPEDVVRSRATTRAEAFVKGDLERSYSLTAPSYRKLRDVAAYKRGFGGGAQWEKAEVKAVSCEPERCKVELSVGVKPLIRGRIGDTITVQFQEIWLLEDGNWWLHQGL